MRCALALLAALLAAPLARAEPAAPPRLAVMTLAGPGVEPGLVEGLTETLAARVADAGVFEVVSPRQVASLLAHERRRELAGGCVDEACYRQVAAAVRAPHLVGGSVAQVDARWVLNLVLVDAATGEALKRVQRELGDAPALLTEVGRAAITLLQPLLESRRGFLRVAVDVPDASLSIDDERRPEAAGQVLTLAAGPHVLRVTREGFYPATADVRVRPGELAVASVRLVPARETIERHETTARRMRTGAYASGALAVGAAVAAAVFYGRASDDKAFVDAFASALDRERPALGSRAEALARRDSFETHQALYLSALGTALVSSGVSLILWLAGEDPDRYAEFRGIPAR
jgi:hypothetical protein